MSSSEAQHPVTPVDAPVNPPKERVGLSLGRLINGAILFIHVAMFITSVCVIGLVGSLMNNIKAFDSGYPYATKSGTCPFYIGKPIQVSGATYSPLAPNGVCLWFIAGHTILAVAAIVFFIVGIVRIVFAMDIGFGTIVELIATPILFVLAFAVAVSLSIGIPITCDNRPYSIVACEDIGFPSETLCALASDVCWYGSAKSAEAAAWIMLIFLFVFFAVSIARLVIFIRRRKVEQHRRQLVEYVTADDPPPAYV